MTAPMGWSQVWAHQSRWARTIRVCQPAPFFMSILANATVWPVLLLASSLSAATIGVSAFCVLFRITTAVGQQSKLTQSQRHLKYWWMPPVKDLLDVVV